MEKFFKILGIVLALLMICALSIFIPQHTILKQDSNIIAVKKQSFYQKWTNGGYKIVNYKQDVSYRGKIISDKRGHHFVGVPGKGGHAVTHYDLVIEYGDGKLYKCRVGTVEYNRITAKPIIVIEEFYPRYGIRLIN